MSDKSALPSKLPAGWTEEQGGQLRYATLRPPGGGARQVADGGIVARAQQGETAEQ